MATIFTIKNWLQSDSYITDDIVKYNGKVYYASKTVAGNTPFSLQNFNGYRTDTIERPYFQWTPSFGGSIASVPRTDIVDFGGFEQRSVKQNNIDPIELDLSFDDRGDNEACAIIHFLYMRQGTEAFAFMAPKPYNGIRLFICEEWQHSSIFAGIHSIKAKFLQVYN